MVVTWDMQLNEVRGDIVNAKRGGNDGSMTNVGVVMVKLVEQLYQRGSAQVHILGLDVGDHGVHLPVVVHVVALGHEHLDDGEEALHNILGV